MGQFTIRVKPEIIQERVSSAQARDIDKITSQFKLDKNKLAGEGIDISDAGHLPFDAFMQLSGNDTKITKADLLKFAGTPTADDIVREYAQKVADSLPAKVMDSASVGNGQDVVSSLEFKVAKRGQDIVIRADRTTLNSPIQPETEATAAGVFSIIGGKDLNKDGQISVAGELGSSVFVQTAGDAVRLAGSDMVVTPSEALNAIFDKAGKLKTADVEIQYTGK